jgi:hypothetical protein
MDLEHTLLADLAVYKNELDYFLAALKHIKYASCQRHYAKILMHITDRKVPEDVKSNIKQIDLQPAIEQCFDWMIDTKVKIAVKVFAARALCNLHSRYPWIKEELANQLQFLMRNGSPAIQSCGKKLLMKL